MGARIGFMESKKAGRCFYCKEEIPISNPPDNKVICGYDNNIKRRICNDCGHKICATGGDAVVATPPAEEKKSKLFSGGVFGGRMFGGDDEVKRLGDAIAKLDERIASLEQAVMGEQE